jgi:2-methylisocitrate lyase-like PEP mutase family enzyme
VLPDIRLAEKARRLRELHHGREVLVLPNAWDCASARIFELEGFPAIATTSGGIAFSLGVPDGQRLSRGQMLAVVERIASTVRVPVTADLEAGYDDAAETAAGLLEAGAVGLNLEDFAGGELIELSLQVERIRTIRATGERAGVPIVINARTDLYLENLGDPESRFELACQRLAAYRDAGADCLFLPGIREESLIRRFVEALRFPINILAIQGTPPLRRLEELGVARVSVGSGIARATLGLTRRIAAEIRAEGIYESMLEGAIPYAELNRMLARDDS